MCGKAVPFRDEWFLDLARLRLASCGHSPSLVGVEVPRKVRDLPHIWRQSRKKMPEETEINRRREEFSMLASGIHLLSHSLGPVPRAARESMLAYYDAWEHHTSEDAWATSWWEMSAQVGDRIARILGGDSGSVQIQPNASIALSSVASCFDFKQSTRNKIVTTALDFPSMQYIWHAQA